MSIDSMGPFNKIIDYFSAQVLLQPDAIAVQDVNSTLTYRQLDQAATSFCSLIQQDFAIEPGDVLAFNSNYKSPYLLAAILGTLKANASFVPLNPDQPPVIINAILQTTQAKILLSDKNMSYGSDFELKNTYEEQFSLFGFPSLAVSEENQKKNSDIVYSIYTSGTTGRPKGVSITNANLVATFHSWQALYQLSNQDKHLQMANTFFDVFIGDWVRALCSGGTLILCQTNYLLQPEYLFNLINQYQISLAEFVPVTLNKLVSYLLEQQCKLPSSFRLLLCGSDLWRVTDAKKALQVTQETAKLYNTYGLTEATIDSTFFPVTVESLADFSPDTGVPIGMPLPHVEISVRDDKFNEVPIGEPGELVIAGAGVSPYGYINALKLTQQRFVLNHDINSSSNPDFNPDSARKNYYRTGDIVTLAQYRIANEQATCLMFQGRNEHQCNINGKRIELNAIEYVLAQYPAVESAIVNKQMINPCDSDSGARLVAYLVLTSTSAIFFQDLYDYLANNLLPEAIPVQFYQIASLPLTSNRKISRVIPPEIILAPIHYQAKPECDSLICDDLGFNNLVREITLLWEKLLTIESIGKHDMFFCLGGNSCLYVQMLENLNQHYHLKLPVNMELDTIYKLATKIHELQYNSYSNSRSIYQSTNIISQDGYHATSNYHTGIQL